MKKTVKVRFIDREWWSESSQQIIGDMGFSFQDRGDTLTRDSREQVREDMAHWVAEYGIEEKGDRETGFPIYLLYEADATFDTEMGEVFMWDVDMDTAKIVDVYVMSTTAGAEGCELQGWYEDNPVFHFLP